MCTEVLYFCRYLGLFAVTRVHGPLSVNHRPVRQETLLRIPFQIPITWIRLGRFVHGLGGTQVTVLMPLWEAGNTNPEL